MRSGFDRGAQLGLVARLAVGAQPTLVYLVAATALGVHAGTVVAGGVSVLSAYVAAVAYNDYHDEVIDRINGRELPLVTGAVIGDDLLRVVRGALLVLLPLQLFLRQPVGGLVVATAVVAGFVYSSPRFAVQARGLWATALLALAYAALPLLLAIGQGSRPGEAVPETLGTVMFLAMAALLYKDFADQPGDRIGGKWTPVLRYGPRRVQLLGAALAAASLPLAPTLAVGVGAVVAVSMAVLNAITGHTEGAAVTMMRIAVGATILIAAGSI